MPTVALPAAAGDRTAAIAIGSLKNTRFANSIAAAVAGAAFDVYAGDDSLLAAGAGAPTGTSGYKLIGNVSATVSGDFVVIGPEAEPDGNTSFPPFASLVRTDSAGGTPNAVYSGEPVAGSVGQLGDLKTLAVGDTPAGGNLGGLSAPNGVDGYDAFLVTQIATGQAITFPNPSSATATKPRLVIASATSVGFSMYGVLLVAGTSQWYFWNGAAWTPMAAGLGARFTVLPHGAAANDGGRILLRELAANGTHTAGFSAPDALAASINWTLPNADGAARKGLRTTGAGVLEFANDVQSGFADLTNGVSPECTVLNMAATTIIKVQTGLRVPGAGNLTRSYDVLPANRTATGFKVTATLDDGTINVLDQSQDIMWTAINP